MSSLCGNTTNEKTLVFKESGSFDMSPDDTKPHNIVNVSNCAGVVLINKSTNGARFNNPVIDGVTVDYRNLDACGTDSTHFQIPFSRSISLNATTSMNSGSIKYMLYTYE